MGVEIIMLSINFVFLFSMVVIVFIGFTGIINIGFKQISTFLKLIVIGTASS